FDAVSEEGQGLLARLTALHALPLRRQALRDPLRQGLAVDRVDADRDAGAIEREEPGTGLLLAVQARQVHHRHDVVRQRVAIALQRLGAFLAGLARGDADLDQLLVREQAQRLRRPQQAAPG